MADRSINIVIGIKNLTKQGIRALRLGFVGLRKVITSTTATLAKFSAGLGLVSAVGAGGIGSLFSAGIRSAAGFEAQLDIVAAKSGATAEQLDQLREAALKAGRETKFTATEAAQGLTILAQAGVDTADSIQILPDLLSLATAENISLAESATFLSATMAQFGIAADDSTRVVDALSKGANLADTNVSLLGSALSFVASSADSTGFTLEQTVAAIDILAESGIKGERGGTGLRAVLDQLSDPASEARRELALLGDTSGTLTGAIDTLSNAGIKGDKVITAFGLVAGPALRALIKKGTEGLDEYTQSIVAANGFSEKTAKDVGDNLTGAFTRLQSALDGINQTLFLPILKPLTQDVDGLANEINAFQKKGGLDGFREAVRGVFGQATESIKTFIFETDFTKVGARVSEFTKNFVANIKGAGASIRLFTNIFSVAVKGLIGLATGPLSLVATGVQKLAVGLNAVGLISDESAQKVGNITTFFNDLHDNVISGVSQDFEDLDKSWTDLNNVFSDTSGVEKAITAEKAVADAADKTVDAQKRVEDALKKRVATQKSLAREIETTENKILQLQRQAAQSAEKAATIESRLAAQQFKNETDQIDLRRESTDGFIKQFQIQAEARARLVEAEKQTKAAVEATSEVERNAAREAAQRNIDRADELQQQIDDEFKRKSVLEQVGTAREKLIESELTGEQKAAEERQNKLELLQQELTTLKESVPTLEIEADISDAEKNLKEIQETLKKLEEGVVIPIRSSGNVPTENRQYGGIIPGTGRGDIIPAMLEPGELVIPRGDVRALGLTPVNWRGWLNQVKRASPINNLRIPTLPTQVTTVQHFQNGGIAQPNETITLNLTFNNRPIGPVTGPRETINDVVSILSEMARGEL